MKRRRFHATRPVAICVLCTLALSLVAHADDVTLKNGMRLQGTPGKIASVRKDPLKARGIGGEIKHKLVNLVDNGMTRTFFSEYQRQSMVASAPSSTEVIKIEQNTAAGRRSIASFGSIIKVTRFDRYGHRRLLMNTARGPVTVIQGITQITPTYTKVEGIAVKEDYKCEMRIATSSIPRETLSLIIMRNMDLNDPTDRWRLVRFYMQCRRYQDALIELEAAMEDFPNLAKFKDPVKALYQRIAQDLLDEIKLRRDAGQHQRVVSWLQSFPTKGVAGEILGEVQEILAEYQRKFDQANKVFSTLEKYTGTLNQDLQTKLAPILEEIKSNVKIHTLNRFADYLQFVDSKTLKPQQKVALGVSGWFLGSGEGTQNLAVAVSLYKVREIVREYMNTELQHERDALIKKLEALEGSSPEYLARLIAHMAPTKVTESQEVKVPGMLELKVPGLGADAEFHYTVQLPLGYHPHRRYPCIVTLNGAGTTPHQQIDWWAGGYSSTKGMRLGQATRRGYIVIAPHWTKQHQSKYGYSAREHAAILYSLQDACRRFSINTDKVFLTGHSIGGDAAWDIGLAHPDLWAGVLPVSARSDKYITRYWSNIYHVPMYFVQGERDSNIMEHNGREFDRYMQRNGIDVMVVEYRGRGHEHFHDEVMRMLEWMDLHERKFNNRSFECTSMRQWDNFYWWVEIDALPRDFVVAPLEWPRAKARDAVTTANVRGNNSISVNSPARKVTVYLTPDMVDFNQRVGVTIKRRRMDGNIKPSVEVMLEDVRRRGDRQHPFWAKVVYE